MKNYISINGKQTELTDEQLKQLGIVVNTKPKWEDLGEVKGSYYINEDCDIVENIYHSVSCFGNKNMFPTEAEAKACLALSQLCQWRDKYNFGWKPDWTIEGDNKFVIFINKNKIKKGIVATVQEVLCFKTDKIRDKFLEDFSELIQEASPLL